MGRTLFFVLVLLCCGTFANSQEMNEKTFDFWIGNWEVSWENTNGTLTKGNNRIVRILGDKVIQENFEDPSSGYGGMSLSIYNSNTKTWHQTWVDSGGGHFNFTGSLVDGNPSFQTLEVKKGNQILQQRMVFKFIKKDAFLWIWEGTQNGGESWTELWKIHYKRKEEK